jgi:hypothetical protein
MAHRRQGATNGAGKAGVWTKDDSVTLFDAFAYGNAGP